MYGFDDTDDDDRVDDDNVDILLLCYVACVRNLHISIYANEHFIYKMFGSAIDIDVCTNIYNNLVCTCLVGRHRCCCFFAHNNLG